MLGKGVMSVRAVDMRRGHHKNIMPGSRLSRNQFVLLVGKVICEKVRKADVRHLHSQPSRFSLLAVP